MKVLLDIKDNKAEFVMELLNNFSFVKSKPLSPKKAAAIENFTEALQQVSDHKAGKIKLKSAKELLDEL